MEKQPMQFESKPDDAGLGGGESRENNNEKIRIDFENRINSLFDILSGEKGSLRIEEAEDIGVSNGSVNGRIYSMVVSDKNRFTKVSESDVMNSIAMVLKESGLRVYGTGGRIYVVSEDPNAGDKTRILDSTQDQDIKKENENVSFHQLYNETGMLPFPARSPEESGIMHIYSNGLISSIEPYLKNGELYLHSTVKGREDLKLKKFDLSLDDLGRNK